MRVRETWITKGLEHVSSRRRSGVNVTRIYVGRPEFP